MLTGDGETGARAGGLHLESTRSPSPARPRWAAGSAPSAAELLKRVTLELGGKSPNIILPDADLDAAVKGVVPGRSTSTPGQACNAGSRLFVQQGPVRHRGVRAGRGREGREGGPRARPGHPVRPGGVQGAVRARDAATSSPASREGAEVVAGGNARDGDGGYFVEPTLFTRDRRHEDRPRGDLRPGAGGACPTTTSRRSPAAPTTPTTAWPPASGRATSPSAHKLAALLKAGSVYINTWSAWGRRGAVRRLQGIRDRARAGPREPGRVPREEDGLDEPEVARRWRRRRATRPARRSPALRG